MSRHACRAVLGSLLLSVAAGPGLAELRWENASGGSTQIYGQLDPGFQQVDDGVATYSTVVDNANSNSRVGLWVRQPTATGRFSFNFETALGFRQSSLVTQGFTPQGANWRRTSIRKVDFAWASDQWGTIYLGQGSVSSDGAAETDLSGTSLVGYSWISATAGAFRFRTAAGALSTRAIGVVMPNFDGGRRGRIRYDTPSFSGFSFSMSYGEEILVQNANLDSTSAALRYAGEAGGFRIRGAVAYAKIGLGAGVTRHDTIGSLSLLHDTGFNVTFAAGSRKESGDYGYAKLGYQGDWFGVGTTAVSVDYYGGSDMVIAGSSSSTIGLQAVQKFDAANIEAYLGYRDYSLSDPGVAYRDMSSILVGARWKF